MEQTRQKTIIFIFYGKNNDTLSECNIFCSPKIAYISPLFKHNKKALEIYPTWIPILHAFIFSLSDFWPN